MYEKNLEIKQNLIDEKLNKNVKKKMFLGCF
jgi:hypothetical protein